MALRGFVKESALYSNPRAGVAVYIGHSEGSGKQVVLKEQTYPKLEAANCSLAEAMNQIKLDHDHIVAIHSASISEEQGFTVRIVMEYMPGGDLFKEIQRRKERQQYWSEDEILSHFRDLSDALAYAEKREIAHRDLKPQNIFIGSDGRLKIGDFGSSSTAAMDHASTTVLGSPYYLSPELKTTYLKMMGSTERPYNPYKSDVFSLAVSILLMETLEINVQLGDTANPSQIASSMVERLNGHPRVQQCLRRMVNANPDDRISFGELTELIDLQIRQRQQAINFTCSVCGNSLTMDWAEYCQRNGSGYFCSERCASYTTPTPCIECGKAVTRQLVLDQFSNYCYTQDLLRQVCSELCLQAQVQKLARLCLVCKCELFQCEGWAISLPCSHTVHNVKCLKSLQNFASTSPQCPLCGSAFNQETFQYINNCCRICYRVSNCHEFPCHHIYCDICGQGMNWMCLDCIRQATS